MFYFYEFYNVGISTQIIIFLFNCTFDLIIVRFKSIRFSIYILFFRTYIYNFIYDALLGNSYTDYIMYSIGDQ